MQVGKPSPSPQNNPNPETTHLNQVIELSSSSSSSQEHLAEESDLKILDKNQTPEENNEDAGKNMEVEKGSPREKKPRKISPRCYICRKVGMRLESRQCTQCKLWYHLECLKTKQSRSAGRFLCGNCDPQTQTQAKTVPVPKKSVLQNKKSQKQKSREIQLTLKFPSKPSDEEKKDKKRELNISVLNNFKEKYPYYIDQNRINFPIQDKLLYIYREIFEVERALPVPDEPQMIHAPYLGDMLIIENFCMSFEGEIEFSFCPTKQVIYSSFMEHTSDLCFKSLLYALLNIYLGDIFDRNKTENVKALNENSFFQLLHFLRENVDAETFLPHIWREVVEKLGKVPSMATAFDGLDKSVGIEKPKGKIHLIKELIMGLSEVDTFHDMMYKKTDKKQDLTKERNELIVELKRDEADILTQSQIYKENEFKIKEIQGQIDINPKKEEVSKLSKELDKLKRPQIKAQMMINKLKENVGKIKTRISEINKSIPFITGEIQLLGRDRNESEYYLYSREPSLIYVNYKSSLLCQDPIFKVLRGKDRISNYIRCLNQKGIKEKQLYATIQNHLKCGVINDGEYTYSQEAMSLHPESFEQSSIQLTPKDIVDILFQCDSMFSGYLSKKNYRWIHPSKKQTFKEEVLAHSNKVSVLRDSLKFMHEQFLYVENLGNGDEESDDGKSEKGNEEAEEEEVKKKRIRLWGIYFEKIKKYWIDYLDSAETLESVWTAAITLRHFVARYIAKKIEGAEEKERKLEKEQEKEREKEKRERHERLERQRHERQNQHESEGESEEESRPKQGRPAGRATTRGRLVRKSERHTKHMNLKELSSEEDQYKQDDDEDNQDSEESHQDACEICGEFGEMLCCDTCPKVFHIDCLKLKQVPDDEWSCVNCLEKIANERQTRSRTRKMNLE